VRAQSNALAWHGAKADPTEEQIVRDAVLLESRRERELPRRPLVWHHAPLIFLQLACAGNARR